MTELAAVWGDLKALLVPYAKELAVVVNSDEALYLNTHHRQKNGKPLFFGAVEMKKNYVSFHLMPIYVRPELLDGISPELQVRMQGKSCFNFKTVDKPLFRELARLTKAGFASYKSQGFV